MNRVVGRESPEHEVHFIAFGYVFRGSWQVRAGAGAAYLVTMVLEGLRENRPRCGVGNGAQGIVGLMDRASRGPGMELVRWRMFKPWES